MKIDPNSKLLFIGDSVTDAGRDYSKNGDFLYQGLGEGYVNIINAYLLSKYPEKRLRVVNQGCSGNTIKDLAERWQNDVIAHQPDWVTMMIGINDVWRQFDIPLITEKHVYLNEYRDTLLSLIKQTRDKAKKMVLMSPYYIEALDNDAMKQKLREYSKVLEEAAGIYDCIYIDIQAVFDNYLKHYHSSQLAWDRIHPNTVGHMLIARAWLNAIGAEW